MKNRFARFGQADKFEIVIGWAEDAEPLARRPLGHGWSMGHLELTVAGISLTASRVTNDRQSCVGWYLAPMLNWLATNWVSLLHEEDFAWTTKDAAPAAVACRRALDFWIGSKDEDGRNCYRRTQAWYQRHGLRNAAAGGLFPDLFIRRFADDIELSWSGEPPLFAPEGLIFESGAGVSRLGVEDVAEPLWRVLQWAKNNPPALDASIQKHWEELCRKIDIIVHLGPSNFESAVVAEELLARVRASFEKIHKEELLDEHLDPQHPYVKALSPAVAMFGGVNPALSDKDIDTLRDLLVSVEGGQDGQRLDALVRNRRRLPIGGVPHEDGYQFAEDLLEDIDKEVNTAAPSGFVNLLSICDYLEIEIDERNLETESIRGVALAGEGFRPLISVNLASVFNGTEYGQRFTIAHEFCHILFDRTRARRIAHITGPWAAAGIEKRANAFAAYLLMPRELIREYLNAIQGIDEPAVRELAARLRVSGSALIEHLYNLDFIDEIRREELRPLFRPQIIS
jgi:Zn-dependent peptidase ImmA (M78 family)